MSDTQASTPKRVPLGEPLNWTDADLDALSEVSAQDIADAEGWAEKHARPRDKGLWKATAEETKP